MSGTTRRALLGSAAMLGAGLTVGAMAAPSDEAPPRIELLPAAIRIHRGAEVTEVRLPLAGVASVLSCPPDRLALGGGFFAAPDGPRPAVRIEDRGDHVRMTGSGIIVEVAKADGHIRFLDSRGTFRIAEAPEPAPLPGVTITRRQGFTIGARERLHGLGQFREPVYEYRDQDVFLAQANSDAVNPFLATTGGWGLLWDTGTAAHLRSRGTALDYHSVAGAIVRYHVCLGATMDAVIERYRALTGPAALLPKWAYGYWQSKERYGTQQELTDVVDEYRRRGLPLDAIVLDWRYWGENDRFSGMRFDPATFPDPKAMVDHVHARDVHILASIWPAFGADTAIYRDMAAGGFLHPGRHWSGGKVFDVTSPAARAIYWRHIKAGLSDIGVDGYWTDGNEPEFLSTGERYGTAASYAANGPSSVGPIAEHLLTFSWYQAQGLSTAMRRDVPAKRPVLLSRSAYAGQQAFGAITWSGDIFASWGTLSNQIVAGLNMAMSGLPYWTCDIGAFLVNHRYPDGLADPAYTELYVRWFQFGAFLPVFRAHGTHVPREIWQFGKPGDQVHDALLAALRLRYALIPYIYAQAAAIRFAGGTILRGLAMDFPDDPACRDQTASYLFGPDLLVRVIDRPFDHASANIQEFLPSRAIQGLSAPAATIEYHEGANFERKLSERLTDDLKMSWSGDLPEALAGKPYSVRWTGRIVAQESGPHELVVTAKGAVRMLFDGRTIVDGVARPVSADGANGAVSFKEHVGDARYMVTLPLVKGRAYPFRLEQRQSAPDAVSLWVEWITPSHRARMAPPSEKAIDVYLPRGQDWYDFADGTRHAGGQTLRVPVRLATLPLYARAGAIIPMTPGIDRATARIDHMVLRIFAGRDGAFTLYDDAGDGPGADAGEAARIAMTWNDRERTLTIAARIGRYPGMPSALTFDIELLDGTRRATHVARYAGRRMVVRL